MYCASCRSELIAGKRFCHLCGARVGNACPHCGAALEESFLFCPDCGTAAAAAPAPLEAERPAAPSAVLAAPAARADASLVSVQIPAGLAQKVRAAKDVIAGERKQVTVMFCDLAGSTMLAARLDPEAYHELLEQYLELAFRAVYRHEGLVNQLAGDGFMALFGAPVAHEDAPQRAVHAALEIHHSLALLNAALDPARGLLLRARLGIHTGPVVVGSVGNDLKMDYSAIGDTTNLAARLEALARPGTVLVSEATYRLIRPRFNVRKVGPLTVKGKPETITAYEVLDLSEAARQEPSAPLALGADRALTPFVGRAPELAQLTSCYERLRDHLPQLATVVGPAGSGKSRLLYEFKERLHAEPVSWFEVRCSAWTQMLPYAPFAGMLRRYFDVVVDEPDELVRDKVARKLRPWDPELDRVFPWLCRIMSVAPDNAEELSDEAMKRGTFDAMGALIYHATERGAVLMLIEDMHWMDDPSREMLYAATAEMFSWPFMVLISHRHDFRPTWGTQPVLTQLNLRRLDDASITEIIRVVAGGPLPHDLETRIREKAEGSPFLAEEISRALIEDGTVDSDGDHNRVLRTIEDIRIPGTVQEVIAARLDQLSPAAKRVVQVAAVVGRQVSRALLLELLREDSIDVDHELEVIEGRGILHRRNIFSNDEYRFGESLTQEVAYEGLLLRQRRQLHAHIGALLERNPGPIDAERTALLVHHFSRSDNSAKTIAALLRAAVDAEQVPSYTTAARLYRQAWDIARSAPESAADPTLQHLSMQAVRGIGRMAVIYSVADPGDNEQVLAQARTVAEAAGDIGALAELVSYEGMLLMQRDRAHFHAGLATIERGLELARQAAMPLPAIAISRALAYGYMLDGRLDLAEQTLDVVVERLTATGHAERMADIYCSARWMLDRVYFFNDELQRSLESSRASLDLAERAGNRTVRCSALSQIGQIAFLRGEYADALRSSEEALTVIASLGGHFNVAGTAAVALLSSLALGRTAGLRRYVEFIAQSALPTNDLGLNAHLVSAALLAVDEVELAERRTQMGYERAGGRLREMHALLGLAAVHGYRGPRQWTAATDCYEQARRLAETLGIRSAIAHATAGSAELAAARGAAGDAAHLLRQAIVLWNDVGMPHYQRIAEGALAGLTSGTSTAAAQ